MFPTGKVLGSILFSASLFLACSSSRDTVGGPPTLGTDGGVDPACQTIRCSRDLKKVLTGCEGEERVIEECGADKGCGDGRCVDACVSAELSKGSIGCNFWTLPPDEYREGSAGSCFVAMIANTWERPVTITASLGATAIDAGASTYYVERDGGKYTYTRVDGPLPPGKVAVVFLSQGRNTNSNEEQESSFIPCPDGVVPAFKEDPIRHGTARTRAFRISTDAPVSAYSIFPYGGARSFVPSATLLLPVSSWGTNYYAINAWTEPSVGRPTIQIVANEDETEVRMRPNVDISDGDGITGIGKGRTQSWTLSRGEVLQITQPDETAESPIESSKPIALFGGSECTFIPWGVFACDTTQQQIPPLAQWGSEYALVPYRPRFGEGIGTSIGAREQVPWRFVGTVDGTTLTYDPARPPGAPETLAAGQVATYTTDQLVTVRSQDAQHPFYASVFMTGSFLLGGNGKFYGDPDFVNVVPTDQFLDRYIFFADHTYEDTTLTFVRRKTSKGFSSVSLECAGEVPDWKPLGTAGTYEYAWMRLTEDGLRQAFAGGECGFGRHEARSDGPFSVTVWGTARAASYGFAGGAGSRPLTTARAPVIQ